MSRLKDETLCIRTSSEIKRLLRLAAERERRSAASMIEILVLEYARAHELSIGSHSERTAKDIHRKVVVNSDELSAGNPGN